MDVNRPHPRSLSPRALAVAGWIAFVAAGAIFLAIAWNVSSRAPLVMLDARVATFLHAQATPGFTTFMLWVTHANSTVGVAVMSLAFAAALARLREWYWMLTLGLAVAGGAALNVMLKYAYARARPHFDDPFLHLASFSFPSGHTAGAVTFYGVLAAFLVSRFYDLRIRATIVAFAIAAVLLVAFSRMYLGAHYFSDVTAAACSSTAWLVLCLATVHGVVRRRMAAAARA